MGSDEEKQYELICKPLLDSHSAKLDKIIVLLSGNGDVGLCETVRTQDNRIKAIETEHAAVRKTIRKYFGGAGTIILGWWLLQKSPEIIAWIKSVL